MDFVHCVFCGADCELPEPPHRADCPCVTGVYPVTPRDLRCPTCGGPDLGFCCARCEVEFKVGDVYTHIELQPGVGECVCLGCAALQATL